MALTWREVSAPDFRGVQTGLSNATQMLNNAASGWNDLLGQRQQMDVRDQAMAIQAQRLTEDQYDFGRRQDVNGKVDAATPALTALSLAAQRNDPIALEAARSGVAGAGLPIDQLNAALTGANTFQNANLRNEAVGLSNNSARTNAEIAAADRADTIAARDAAINIQRMTPGSDPAVARVELEKLRGTMTPGAFAKVLSQFPNAYGALGTSDIPVGTMPGSELRGAAPASPASVAAGLSAIPSPAGTAGTKAGSAYDVGYQFKSTPAPLTTMKMGDVSTHQASMIRDQGASPVGAFQINKATLEDFAPRVLGSNWRDLPFSPENQEKIGEAIFNSRKGGNLKETWAALPDATPGAYANRTWADVRGEISQREVGTSVANPTASIPGTGPVGRLENAAQRTTVAKAAAQQSSGVIAGIPAAREADIKGAFASDVVDSLKKTIPSLEGVPRQDVQAAITKVMREANVGPNEAALVLRDAAGGQNVWQDTKQFFGFESKPTRLDDDRVKAGIELLKSTAGDAQNLQLGETVRTANRLQAARDADVEATKQLKLAEERSKTQPLAESYMNRLREEARLAEQNLRELTNTTRNDETVRPNYPAQTSAAQALAEAATPQPQGLIQIAKSRRDTPPNSAPERMVWEARQNLRLAQRNGDPGLIQGYQEELRRANEALRAAAN